MNNSESIKCAIQLTKEQSGSFPVSVEHLWFDKEGESYHLKNIPQFVDELSFGDVVKLKAVSEESYLIQSVIKPSQNSTIWVLFKEPSFAQEFIEKVKIIGCGIEGGAFEGYYAINVPIQVNIEECYKIIDAYEARSILVADYPSLRQGD